MRCVHFVGFRDDRYWNAVRIWGLPHYIHRGWDLRAQREIGPKDTVVFATGDEYVQPRRRSFADLDEAKLIPIDSKCAKLHI
jgi:hypothetical protein